MKATVVAGRRFASILLAAALMAPFATESNALELTVGVVNPPDDPTVLALNKMKEKLEAGTSGITLEVFASGQLGSETDLVEQTRLGAVSMTTVANSVVSTFSPPLGVIDIPYLLTLDNDHAWRVLDGDIGKRLAAEAEKDTGLKLIAWWNAGVRNVYTHGTPVMSPQDLAGLRIRVIGSPVYLDTFNALGAQAVAMPLAEIYTSLATGAIDAGESDTSGYRVMKFNEQAPYYSFTKHILLIRPLLMNADVWDGMSNEQKNEFNVALEEITAYQRDLFAKRVGTDVQWMQENGVKVFEPDLAPFKAAVEPVIKKYSDKFGPETVQAIRDAY